MAARRSGWRRAAVGVLVLAAGLVVRESAGVAEPVCPDGDTNNSSGSAEPLAGGVSDRSICSASGDERDWFSLGVARGDLVAVDLFVESGAGELDVTLRQASGAVLVAAASSGDAESLRYRAIADATLLVEVFERGDDADGEYSLFASVGPAGPCGEDEDALEPNDARGEATVFGSGGAVEGWVCVSPDVFRVRVVTASPDPLAASLTLGSGAGDLDLGLYSSAGVLLDSSTGTTGSESVTVPAPVAAGDYFVEVFGYEGASGGYSLEVEGAGPSRAVHGEVTTWDPPSRREVAAPDVTVGAHAASAEGEVAVTAADGDGLFGFDFGQLPVGSYRLRFTEPDGGGGVWATEWFDNKASHATATNVAVTEADLVLPPVLLQLVIQAEPYTDVSSGHTAYDAVRYIFTYNLLEGVTGTTFEPSSSLSRAEFVRLLYRLAGRPAACDPGYSEPFVDVATSHFAHAAITWATCNPAGPEPPIATGSDSTHFDPGGDLTRGPAARMTYRLAGELSTSGLPAHPFTDVSGGLDDAVTWAYWDADGGGPLLRLISGITATTFVPSGSLTRGQAANLVWRLARSELHWDQAGGSAFWPDPATVPGSVLFR